MEKENFKDINSGEINPLEEFIIDRSVWVGEVITGTYSFLYNLILITTILSGIIYYGAIGPAINNFFYYNKQKIKKFFSRFIITDEEYTKFNSP